MRGASGDDPDAADDGEDSGDRAVAGDSTAGDEAENTTDGDAAEDSTAEDRAENSPNGTVADDLPKGTPTQEAETDQPDGDSEIDPAELTVSERSLHPRIRTLWIARAIVWAFVVGAIAFVVDWQWLGVGVPVPAAVTAVALITFVIHAVLRYRAWQYEFREDAIYLERGVLTRVRTVVPFVRIQHIDTARGPVERAAGLSTLVVYTAGSRGADVTIPGIQAERATDHQRRLKQLAIAAEDDTAV